MWYKVEGQTTKSANFDKKGIKKDIGNSNVFKKIQFLMNLSPVGWKVDDSFYSKKTIHYQEQYIQQL